jgi:hypothetical protein
MEKNPMTREEKAIYTAGGMISLVTALGMFCIGWVINNRVRRVEVVVNTLPERLVKVIRSNVGF